MVNTAPKKSVKKTIVSNTKIVIQVIGKVFSFLSLSILATFSGVSLNSNGIIAVKKSNIITKIFGKTSAFKVSPKTAGAGGNLPAS